VPPTQIADPVLTVSAWLKADWNAANTLTLTPTVAEGGWYNRANDISVFKVTVTPAPENQRSGYLGAAGPGALWDGSVDVNIWTSPNVFASGTAMVGRAKALAYKGRQEVDRIIRVNQLASSELLIARILNRIPLPDTRERPVVFRWLCEVGYSWIELAA
jgi:hypothetical protein